MADKTTQYGDLELDDAIHASKRMLRTAQYHNITAKYADVDELPQHAGDTLKLRRYEDWSVPEAPLSEVLDPDAVQPTFVDVEVVVEEYGQIARLTKKIKLMHQHPVFKKQFELAGKSAGRCSQKVDFNALVAGSNVYYANNATGRTTLDATVSNTGLKKIVRQFMTDGIDPITSRLKAGPDIDTEPIEESYVAFIHPHTRADCQGLDDWTEPKNYASGQAEQNEIGACEGVRFLFSKDAKVYLAGASSTSSTSWLVNGARVTSASTPDVYPIIVIGQNVWSRVPLAGHTALKPMVVNPGKPNAADPTGRKGFVSWLGYFAAVITWEAGVARYEVCATAL